MNIAHVMRWRKNMITDTAFRILNLTQRTPTERNLLLFQAFKSMKPCCSFIFLLNKEPMAIHSQLQYEHEGNFDWKYLEEGPETWRVLLTKKSD